MLTSFVFSVFGAERSFPLQGSFFQLSGGMFEDINRQESCPNETGQCQGISEMDEKDPANQAILQQCALDLCGPPKAFQKLYIYSDREHTVPADLMREWTNEFHALGIGELIEENVDREMEPFKRLQTDFQQKGISSASEFDFLKPEDYDSLSRTFFDEYIRWNSNGNQFASDHLSVQIHWPEGASKQLKRGIGAYALERSREMRASFNSQISFSSRPEKELLCQEKACRQALEEMVGALFSPFETFLLRESRINLHFTVCRSEFISLKQLEKDMAEGLDIPALKRNFIDRVLKDFSATTREAFESYISKGFPIIPFVPKPQDFRDLLERRNNRWLDEASVQIKKPDGKAQESDSIDNVEQIVNMYWEKKALEKNGSLLCESLVAFQGRDGFMLPQPMDESTTRFPLSLQQMKDISLKGAVSLSLFSWFHPAYGRRMVSHELGHLLSWLFKQNKLSGESYDSYKKLRDCATRRYKTLKLPNKSPLLHENDQWNTEENTADLIADLAVPDRQIHSVCSQLRITTDGTRYGDLNILNDNSKGGHSTPFLRVLFEAIHKRVELSPACQQVVDKYEDQISFELCF